MSDYTGILYVRNYYGVPFYSFVLIIPSLSLFSFCNGNQLIGAKLIIMFWFFLLYPTSECPFLSFYYLKVLNVWYIHFFTCFWIGLLCVQRENPFMEVYEMSTSITQEVHSISRACDILSKSSMARYLLEAPFWLAIRRRGKFLPESLFLVTCCKS